MPGWTCTTCGNENPEGTRFCGHCGTPADAAAETPAGPTAVEDALRSFVSTQVADRVTEAGGKIPEERRLITALFADISGFTPLADRLDPEELLEVIDPVVSALSSIVARYEGYVEKYAGDALLALFGAPVSHDDDAERALRVATEMHAELASMRDVLPEDAQGLTLHVGVNSGHGIARVLGSEARTDYAVLGDAVILAQRLESAAPPGETYVSDSTYRLTRSRFRFENVGELTLKGKSQTVRAWRLLGEAADAAKDGVRLVGRSDELRSLVSKLDDLGGGRGARIAIVGEPGVGKTRLTGELHAAAGERGIEWLQGRCISYGRSLPYWPYVELVRRLVGIGLEDDDSSAAERLAKVTSPAAAPFFSRLLGLADDGPTTQLEPEAFRRGLHDAFAEWLRSHATARPTLVVLEDVHWADDASLTLTRDLVERLADAPVGFVLNGRPEASEALAELPGEWLELLLAPLRAAELDTLAAELLGASAPEELASFLWERTGGNPFFTEEVIRALRDAGTLIQQNGAWRMKPGWSGGDVPPTVEGVLSARIDLLPRQAATVLQTAAVIGRRQRVALLAAVAGDNRLRESLDELSASGLIHPALDDGEEAFEFRHALVVDVAYSRLLRRRQRELHLRVAEEAERLYGGGGETIGLLARHLYLAEAGDRAVAYLVRAGRHAKQLYANEEAIQHLERALELAPDNTEVPLELADLYDLVGGYAHAGELYEAVRDATVSVRAWQGIAATLRKQGQYTDALQAIDQAFKTPALADADLRPLWLERARSLAIAGHIDESIDAAQAGLTSVPERDIQAAWLLVHLAHAETVIARCEDALNHGLEAKHLFEGAGPNLRGLSTALRVLGDVYRELGRLDEAAGTLREGLSVAERVGNVEELGGCLINLGIVEALRGSLEEAIANERRAIVEFERIGHGSGRVLAYENLGEMLMEGGDYDEALEACSTALELAAGIGHSLAVGGTLETIAQIHFRQERYAAAGTRAEEAAARSLEIGIEQRARRCFELAAEAWTLVGENERAEACEARARSLDQLSS